MMRSLLEKVEAANRKPVPYEGLAALHGRNEHEDSEKGKSRLSPTEKLQHITCESGVAENGKR